MSILTAKTQLNDKLHIVDFSKTKPYELKELYLNAIEKANEYLKKLEQQPEVTSSEQALSDIIEFDHLNIELSRSWGILSHLNSVMSNDDIRHAHHEVLSARSAYSTKVGQHSALFNRYNAIQTDSNFFTALSPARQRAIELSLHSFKLSGVTLANDEQRKYGEIQSQLSKLSAKFSDNILDATQAFALPLEIHQLQGITQSGLALLASAGEQYKTKLNSQLKNAKDVGETDLVTELQAKLDTLPIYKEEVHKDKCYVATLDIPIYLAIMNHAKNRELRESIYKAYVTRASEFDDHKNTKGERFNNSDNMTQIMKLREQKSKLLGFNNYGELSLATKMADSSEQVELFLRALAEKAKPLAKQDLNELTVKAKELDIINENEALKPWDSSYVAEKVKQDKFSLSQEEIRPYFPLPKVIDGMFTIVNRLFNVRAVDHSGDVPLWHEDARFYQLYDADNSLIGGFYFDLYARQGKSGGAWMSGFQAKYKLEKSALIDVELGEYEQLPVCFMVGNFTPPISDSSGKKPSLLTHNEVTTLFHEFGHGLHHLLTKITVEDVAGVNGVEWDAVELPSQFLENWAWNSEGIKLISSHVDTGEPLPANKLKALLNAKNFQSGMMTLRQIEFALFDLLAHSQSNAPDYSGLLAQLDVVRKDVSVIDTPDYNRFANGFSHIFAGGYACGYFSYKWSELLSADAFGKFEAEGIFNPNTGNDFRKSILEVGGSLPAKVNFEKFRGREASVDALLRHSGFVMA